MNARCEWLCIILVVKHGADLKRNESRDYEVSRYC